MKQIYQSPMTRSFTVTLKYHLLNPSIQTSANPASVNGSGDYETLSRRDSSFWDDDVE